jgi:hypothetical protein
MLEYGWLNKVVNDTTLTAHKESARQAHERDQQKIADIMANALDHTSLIRRIQATGSTAPRTSTAQVDPSQLHPLLRF